MTDRPSTTHHSKPKRGEIWLVGFDPTLGREQAGSRPALIVSNNSINAGLAELVVVAPITGTDRGIPVHVKVDRDEGGLTKPSVIMCDQIRAISTRRLSRRLGAINASTMKQVEVFLRLVLDL